MGDVEIKNEGAIRLAVFYLENPLPLSEVGLDIYPTGRVNLYARADRLAILDHADARVPLLAGSVEAFDKGRTLVLEIESPRTPPKASPRAVLATFKKEHPR